MLPPEAPVHVVAAYLCDGAHTFAAEADTEAQPEDDALPRRALDWRTAVEERLGAAANLTASQAECMAAQLLGRDTVHLAPTGSGKSLCFLLDALAGAVCGPTVVISPLQSLILSQAATVEAWIHACPCVYPCDLCSVYTRRAAVDHLCSAAVGGGESEHHAAPLLLACQPLQRCKYSLG